MFPYFWTFWKLAVIQTLYFMENNLELSKPIWAFGENLEARFLIPWCQKALGAPRKEQHAPLFCVLLTIGCQIPLERKWPLCHCVATLGAGGHLPHFPPSSPPPSARWAPVPNTHVAILGKWSSQQASAPMGRLPFPTGMPCRRKHSKATKPQLMSRGLGRKGVTLCPCPDLETSCWSGLVL